MTADETVNSKTPAALVVIVAQDSPATDTFSQDIQYKTADGTLVKTASGVINGNFTGGSGTATMSNVNSLIDSNMPAGYEYVSGKLTADETVNSKTPAALVVIVKRAGSTPTPEQGEVTITYVDKDNPSHVLGTASVTGNNGSSVAVADTINNNVPAHWKIDPSFTVPTSETVPGSVTVPLVHATKTIKPDDPGVDPNKPDYQDMFKTVTRTINVNNPDGSVARTLQQVHFNRSKTVDEVTGKVISYGDWSLADGSARNWGEFDVPQLSGYTSYVDGTAATTVNAENVTADTADVTVEVTYKTAGDHGQQPSNPGDNNHNNGGNHGNGNNNGNNGNGGNNGGAINNGANGATNLNNGNGNNGNGQAAKKLPQTGNDQNAAAVAGLGLAGLAAMFGLGKRKKED